MKKISIVCMTVIVCMMLASCGSIEKKLSGHWVSDEPGGFYYIDFFSDGTYSSRLDNYQGTYSVDGDRMRLEGFLVSDKVVDFKLKGNTLILNGTTYHKE